MRPIIRVNSWGTDTESEDASDSDDEDLSAPIGRNTLCALSDGFTTVHRGTAWKAAQVTAPVGPATGQVHHNSFEALGDNNAIGMAVQLASQAHIMNRPLAATIGKCNPIEISCEKHLLNNKRH